MCKTIGYILFLCALSFEFSTQHQFHMQIPLPAIADLRKQAEICSQETGVPAINLRKIIDKTLPNDTPHKQFFQCVAYNTGYVDKDGHFVLDKMLTFNIVNGTKDDLVQTIDECNEISLGVNLDTLFATADCIHKIYLVTVQN